MSETAPPTSYRNVTGQKINWSFQADADESSPLGPPFRDRVLTSTGGPLPGVSPGLTQVLQRRLVVPAETARWQHSDRLDNEIRIGLHLVRVFGTNASYPPELSRLVGYDVDAEQPFVLLAPYAGVPAGDVVHRLKLDQEQIFEVGLLKAIRLLDAAGVVHGGISPTAVRWDDGDEIVQVTGFSQSSLANEPRRLAGDPPWTAPDRVAGDGVADPRDDVWSAAQVIYYVMTGRTVRAAAGPPDPSPRGQALRAVLGKAFAPAASARPRSLDLLDKLKVPDPWPYETTTEDSRFLEGKRLFAEKLADKSGGARARQAASAQLPSSTPPTTGNNGQAPPPASPRTPPRPSRPAPQHRPRRRGFFGWFARRVTAAFITTSIRAVGT